MIMFKLCKMNIFLVEHLLKLFIYTYMPYILRINVKSVIILTITKYNKVQH